MTSRIGEDIMTESFRIIEAEVGEHSFGRLEWPIVRRIIHASGDVELAHWVHFTPGATDAGLRAFRERVPIVTDVRMVAAGIQAPLREALGVSLHCALDVLEMTSEVEYHEKTRCARAMQCALAVQPEAIFVIGNAPTALSVLCAAVRRGDARPRLVIAMPVGFVGVIESKEQALSLPVPIIAVRGRRGGSAIAAAAVNALLVLASEEKAS